KQFIQPSPKIAFLTGHGERSPFVVRSVSYRFITSAKKQRRSLINQGYKVDTLSLINRNTIPNDIAGLAIVDPKQPYSREELDKLNKYIESGGNLFIAGEPDHRDAIQPVMNLLGLTLREGRLAQSNKYRPGNVITGYLTPAGQQLSEQFNRSLSRYTKFRGDSTYKIRMKTASGLEYQDNSSFTVKPLVKTEGGKTWIRHSLIPRDSLHTKLEKPATSPDG